jgi:NAD(P)-dependent dehydrogenase (short-subunit alcohol dehydrogenase family)
VVITGGAGGLGKVLAETYGMRGVSVAVLDIREPAEQSEALENVRFYRCDVSSIEDVREARMWIEKDVRSKCHRLLIRSCSSHIQALTSIPPSSALAQS